MAKPVVEVDTEINADKGAVWKALTTPDLMSEYFLGAEVRTDWKVGHPIEWAGEWKGKAFCDRGEIKTFKPEQELSFTHWSEMAGKEDRPENYHTVRFELEPVGDRTLVTLSQTNADPQPVDAKTRAEFEKNWRTMLDGLKKTAEKQ